jgi:exopolyphosphatase/guanosine-5'-triphosphate,3'-diphosphate pyrophosphatase
VTPESERFPFRVAAIDAGSNAIRFVAAEFVDPAHWVELEIQRVPIRLGHDVFLTGELDPDAMDAAVEAMSAFRRAIDTHGVARYRAVATSAVRESRNGGTLVDRIRRECGVRLETITGSEEARLVWLAVRHRFDVSEGRWLTADLGGGSLEVSLVSLEGIHWSESHQMGTVRLLEDLGGGDGLEPDEFLTLAREYAGTLRISHDVELERLEGMIATGGNIETLADLAGGAPDERGVSFLTLEDLRGITRRLAGVSLTKRMARFGLRQDRADVIVPAALLYERVAVLAGVDSIVVPRVGVKEGLLLDLAEDIAGPGVHASRLEQQAFYGAVALGRRFHFDEPHGRHVGRLVLSMFDQLRDVHELDDVDRRILLVAAVLHDVGQFVAYRRHHKHSLYLIENSDLPNVSEDERPLVALIARYHRRAEPRSEHYLYHDLGSADRHRVRKLAALLRLADSLDREHQQRVSTVAVLRNEDEITLEARGHGDLLLEQWAFRKKARMFTSVYGLDVRLVVAEPVLGPGVI